ncbi:MAG TPA: hypothetical protein PKL06_08790 [Chitinophagales bacterium]|nr:hypothetical protein [Chitinophagales bacterium]
MCAEGSQNQSPARKAAEPDPAQLGRQREVITICKPAPEVRNSTAGFKTDTQSRG